MVAGALMISEQSVAVPMPPSTNTLFINIPGRGRVKNGKYRTWQLEAIPILRTSLTPIQGAVKMHYHLSLGTSFRGDISNRIKALEDAVVEAGIIEGDTHKIVSEILITRDYVSGKNSYIILRLSKAEI
jgi:Holliday junction resolvase RusA-like endonuclease